MKIIFESRRFENGKPFLDDWLPSSPSEGFLFDTRYKTSTSVFALMFKEDDDE